MKAKVGVREIRQNLSVYLDRVKDGETLTVTEHGRDVALLTPLPKKEMNVLERMVAEGRATAPTESLRNLRLPKPGPPGLPRSEDILAELREERLP
ncbi:MAG TPA: type II toxin-antitoxin system prevent-host-death family antitoxin [Vicinamibacterales bacterium]|nr:type II toxin-antitoxin system prevent-host-death family antitoxin [Vicinamibacterales bacterium]